MLAAPFSIPVSTILDSVVVVTSRVPPAPSLWAEPYQMTVRTRYSQHQLEGQIRRDNVCSSCSVLLECDEHRRDSRRRPTRLMCVAGTVPVRGAADDLAVTPPPTFSVSCLHA